MLRLQFLPSKDRSNLIRKSPFIPAGCQSMRRLKKVRFYGSRIKKIKILKVTIIYQFQIRSRSKCRRQPTFSLRSKKPRMNTTPRKTAINPKESQFRNLTARMNILQTNFATREQLLNLSSSSVKNILMSSLL